MTKIIHQTWKTSTPPPEVFNPEWVNSWISLNPDWHYILWTDQDIADFVARHFPAYYAVWCSYPKHIMRVDAWRLLVLKVMGGLYVDLDVACLEPLDDWIHQFRGFCAPDQGDQNLSNAVMWASAPGLPFLDDIEEALMAAAYQPHPFFATGPNFLEAYAKEREGIYHYIPTDIIFPVTVWDRQPLPALRQSSLDSIRSQFPVAKMVTFWTGTWTSEGLSIQEPEILDRGIRTINLGEWMLAIVKGTGEEFPEECYPDLFRNVPELAIRHFSLLEKEEGEKDEPHEPSNRAFADMLDHFLASGKEYLFVCEEGTYVVPERLKFIVEPDSVFVCNESVLVHGHLSRRAGYVIASSLAAELLASGSVHCEDDLLTYISDHEVPLEITSLLRSEHSRYPTAANTVVSTWIPEPSALPTLAEVANGAGQTYTCFRGCERTFISFTHTGACFQIRPLDTGKWTDDRKNVRTIRWASGATETMRTDETEIDVRGDVISVGHLKGESRLKWLRPLPEIQA